MVKYDRVAFFNADALTWSWKRQDNPTNNKQTTIKKEEKGAGQSTVYKFMKGKNKPKNNKQIASKVLNKSTIHRCIRAF